MYLDNLVSGIVLRGYDYITFSDFGFVIGLDLIC